mmetsp:Transcript_121777/g.190226  ORF Transcript_121777/g.190226 Transcript_121777/m.190226 type:complete len:162 (+) Transcript_121777:34-519(+)
MQFVAAGRKLSQRIIGNSCSFFACADHHGVTNLALGYHLRCLSTTFSKSWGCRLDACTLPILQPLSQSPANVGKSPVLVQVRTRVNRGGKMKTKMRRLQRQQQRQQREAEKQQGVQSLSRPQVQSAVRGAPPPPPPPRQGVSTQSRGSRSAVQSQSPSVQE